VSNLNSQLKVVIVCSMPVDEWVDDLRRLRIDALAESTERLLRPSTIIGASTYVFIHASVIPERTQEIKTFLRRTNPNTEVLISTDENPIRSAIDLARMVQSLAERNSATPDSRRPVTVGEKTILVVDDDAILRRALKRTIRRLPAAILEANDPEDANKFLGQVNIDLIMSDYSFLGDENGLDFLRNCREKFPNIPRMLLSGHDLSMDEDLPGDRSAADAIIQKPWDMQQFLTTCRTLLDQD